MALDAAEKNGRLTAFTVKMVKNATPEKREEYSSAGGKYELKKKQSYLNELFGN